VHVTRALVAELLDNDELQGAIARRKSYGYVYGGNDGAGVPEIVARTTSGAGTSSVLSDPVTGQTLNLTTADGVTGLYLILRRRRIHRQDRRPPQRPDPHLLQRGRDHGWSDHELHLRLAQAPHLGG
jgi:hypothetical protein